MKKQRKNKKLIIFMAIIAILALSICFLPWYLSGGMIQNVVIKDLESQLSRKVTIGSCSAGWKKGIELRDLVVERHRDFGKGVMIRIGRLVCPFSPLDFWKNKLGWLKAEDVHLFMVIRPDGRNNLLELPPMSLEIPRINFKNGRVHVLWDFDNPQSELVMNATGQFDQDSLTGQTDWSAHAFFEEDPQAIFFTQGSHIGSQVKNGLTNLKSTLERQKTGQKKTHDPSVTIDQSSGDTQANLYLQGCVTVENLNLSQLPLPVILKKWTGHLRNDIPTIEQLAGKASFALNFEGARDQTIDVNCDAKLAGLILLLKETADGPEIVKDFGEEARLSIDLKQQKKEGQSFYADMDGTITGRLHGLDFVMNARTRGTGNGGDDVEGWRVENVDIKMATEQVENALKLLPKGYYADNKLVVGEKLIIDPHGPLKLEAGFERTNGSWKINYHVNGDNMAFEASDRSILWAKNKGTAMRASGNALFSYNSGLFDFLLSGVTESPVPMTVHITTCGLDLGGSHLDIAGNLGSDSEYEEILKGETLPNLCQGNLKIGGKLDFDHVLVDEIPFLAALKKRFALGGAADLNTELQWQQSARQFSVKQQADLTNASMRWQCPVSVNSPIGPGSSVAMAKAVGEPCKIDFTLESQGTDVAIKDFKAELLSATIEGRGLLKDANRGPWFSAAGEGLPGDLELSVKASCSDMSQFNDWLAPLEISEIEGAFDGQSNFVLRDDSGFTGAINTMGFDSTLQCKVRGIPLELDVSEMRLTPSHLYAPAVRIKLDNDDLTAVADLRGLDLSAAGADKFKSRPKGELFVRSKNFDAETFGAHLKTVLQMPDPSPGQWYGRVTLADESLASLLKILRQSDVSGDAVFGHLSYVDFKTEARINLEQFIGRFDLNEGELTSTYQSTLNGGVFNGSLESDLNDADPQILCHFDGRNLGADAALNPMIQSEFPGLQVDGTISEHYDIETSVSCLLDPFCDWQGEGITVCKVGVLYGAGGPAWMMSIFPGLELMEYAYKEMTNTFERFNDGRKKNHLVFRGIEYDIYMDGQTTPVRDPEEYVRVLDILQEDINEGRLQLGQLQKKSKDKNKIKLTRTRLEGLEMLSQKAKKGTRLRVGKAEYVIGGLLATGGKALFKKPTELLRIPFFETSGYIVGQYMIGIRNTNANVFKLK